MGQGIPLSGPATAAIHSATVLSFSPDGKYVVVGGPAELKEWSVSNGALVWSRAISGLQDVSWTADSSSLYAGGALGLFRLGPSNGQVTVVATGAAPYVGVSGGSSQYVASFDGTSTVSIRKTSDGSLVKSFTTSDGPFVKFAGSDETKLTVGTGLYNTSGSFLGRLSASASDTTIGFNSPAKSVLFTATSAGHIHGYSVSTLSQVFDVNASGLGLTPDSYRASGDHTGKYFAVGGNEPGGSHGRVTFYSQKTGAVAGTVNTSAQGLGVGVALSPASNLMAVEVHDEFGDGKADRLELYKFTTAGGTVTGTFFRRLDVGQGPVSSLTTQVTPVGHLLIAGTATVDPYGTTLRTSNRLAVQRATGIIEYTPVSSALPTMPTHAAAISPSGTYAAVCTPLGLRVIDWNTGAVVAASSDIFAGVDFFGDDSKVVVGAPGNRGADHPRAGVYDLDLTAGEPFWYDGSFGGGPIVSPDGVFIASSTINSEGCSLAVRRTDVAAGWLITDEHSPFVDYGFLDNRTSWLVTNPSAGQVRATAYRAPKYPKHPGIDYGPFLYTFDHSSPSPVSLAACSAMGDAFIVVAGGQTDAMGVSHATIHFFHFPDGTRYDYDLPDVGSGVTALASDGKYCYYGTADGTVASVVVPPALHSVRVAALGGGESGTGRVSLYAATPAPVTINLWAPTGFTVPSSVVIPAGASSATFPITAPSVANNQRFDIVAGHGGERASCRVLVRSDMDFILDPAIVVGGKGLLSVRSKAAGIITLKDPAPAGGYTVSLTSSSDKVIVPATVTVPEGSIETTFDITVPAPSTGTSATLTADDGFHTAYQTIKVIDQRVYAFVNPQLVIGGRSRTAQIELDAPAPVGGATVSLSSSQPSAFSVPATVTVPEGAKTAEFTISSSPVASTVQNQYITATLGASTWKEYYTVVPPNIGTVKFGSDTVSSSTTTTVNMIVRFNGTFAPGLTLSLKSDSAYAGVPSSVSLPAGQSWVSVPVTIQSVPSTQTVTITATPKTGINETATGILTINP